MSQRRGPDTLDLTLGQPSHTPDPEVLERALQRYWEGPPGYTENAGLLGLREAIARHHELQSPQSVVVTVGSEQAVYLTLSCVIEPGDEVLIPEPGYPAYRGIVQFLGGVAVPYPLVETEGFGPNVDALEALGTAKTRMLIWNAPSNPFGAVPTTASTERALILAEARGWSFLSDEIYRDLVYSGERAQLPSELSSAIFIVSGLSKSCALTGFRLGYVCGPQAVMPKLVLANQLMVTCAPRLSQLMALEILAEPERLTAHKPFYAEARQALMDRASDLPPQATLRVGDGAFYATVDVRPWLSKKRGITTLSLALDLLAEEDVAVVPGVAFGIDTGDWFWRLSYAAGPSSAAEGMSRLARFLSHRKIPADI